MSMPSNRIWDWVPFRGTKRLVLDPMDRPSEDEMISGEIEFMFDQLSKPLEY